MNDGPEMISIGQLARDAGCSVDTIRFYERVGLLPAVSRSLGGQRRYGQEHLRQLELIRSLRSMNLGLTEIRDFLSRVSEDACSCADMRELLSRQITVVRRRMAELEIIEEKLQELRATCGDGQLDDCRLIEPLMSGSRERFSGCC